MRALELRELTGKAATAIGGSRGIGQAIAEGLAPAEAGLAASSLGRFAGPVVDSPG